MSDDGQDYRVRTIGSVCPDDDDYTVIWVDHIYTMDVGEAGHPDEGLVGIMIQSGDVCADAVMTAQEALLLADRLTRGAHLVL